MSRHAEQLDREGLLSPYRVLDLTDEKGQLCGKILADLGADVIKVEKPGGDASRNIGPFYKDVPHPEKSLFWFAFNLGKKSITLNIQTVDGKDIFKRLVRDSDFVIESFHPGYMAELGLGYPVLSEVNRRVILTSVSPFGQSGPYRDYQSTDIVSMAMGGLMHHMGDSDRPPVRISVPQSYPQAGAQAAMGTLIAHYNREITGEGQWVDLSIQAVLLRPLVVEIPSWDLNRVLMRRLGASVYRGKILQREIWKCKDGQVCFRLLGGPYTRGIIPLVEWMREEGMAGVLADVKDWRSLEIARMSQQENDAWEEAFSNFFLKHTMAEMYKESMKRHIFLMPCDTVKDVVENEQLSARDYWVKLEHPELESFITYPGAPYKFTGAYCGPKRRAPLIGEHNEEVYAGELGLTQQELPSLKEANVI